MKKNILTSVIGVCGLTGLAGVGSLYAQDAPDAPAAPAPAPAAPSISDEEATEVASYLLGFQSAAQYAQGGIKLTDIDQEVFQKGFNAGFSGEKPSYEDTKIQAAMQSMGKKVQERSAKEAEANLAAGKAFLEKNKSKEGVTTTESGLQYEILEKGSDKKYEAPAEGDKGTQFMVNYRGTLIDGTEFDKSPEGQPFPMSLQVIPGFKEALTTMPVGAKWKLYIPSDLAYGPSPAGPLIKANSTLIFELELIEIKTPPAPEKTEAVTPPVPVPAAE